LRRRDTLRGLSTGALPSRGTSSASDQWSGAERDL